MTMTIHTWKVLHNWASKDSLYFNKWKSVHSYNGKPFSPALTSLEEGASRRIYIIYRPSSPRGAQFLMESSEIKWRRVHQCINEVVLSLLVNWGLDWADTSTHKLTHQSTEHPGESTHVEERERAQLPIKTVEDLIWSPPSVKDLSDLVNLLQIWLISIKSADLWFWISSIIHQFIN